MADAVWAAYGAPGSRYGALSFSTRRWPPSVRRVTGMDGDLAVRSIDYAGRQRMTSVSLLLFRRQRGAHQFRVVAGEDAAIRINRRSPRNPASSRKSAAGFSERPARVLNRCCSSPSLPASKFRRSPDSRKSRTRRSTQSTAVCHRQRRSMVNQLYFPNDFAVSRVQTIDLAVSAK